MSDKSHSNSFSPGSGQVLISSLYPLGGNYGGIMQAYALQRVIRAMGFSVSTINSKRRWDSLRFSARRGRHFFRKLAGKSGPGFPLNGKQRSTIQHRPKQFIQNNLHTIDFFSLSKKAQHELLLKTKAIVVGSDQVWRGGYADVLDQLLQYAVSFPIIKFSYAASFGADHLIRFGPRTVRRSKNLIQNFSAVSVREASGIDICREVWGQQATYHIDPTLLLTRDDYEELINRERTNHEKVEAGIFAYILDRNSKTDKVIATVADELNLPVSSFFMDSPPSSRALRANPERFQMKSISEWLENFSSAKFVVTDSFHGTVFSIIFRKPFVSIGNQSRGLSRFESLLEMLGLESRLVNLDTSDYSVDYSEPDWITVSEKLQKERSRSFEYLATQLNP